jgi:hypothetical protein
MSISVSLLRACTTICTTVVLAARCAAPGPTQMRDVPSVRAQARLRYEASQETPGPQAVLRARVRVTNEADTAVAIEAPGGCPLRLLVYGLDRLRTDTSAVWDSNGPREGVACIMSLHIVRLAPSQSHIFYGEVARSEFIGARIATGSYQVLVGFEAAPQLGLLNAGTFAFRKD